MAPLTVAAIHSNIQYWRGQYNKHTKAAHEALQYERDCVAELSNLTPGSFQQEPSVQRSWVPTTTSGFKGAWTNNYNDYGGATWSLRK